MKIFLCGPDTDWRGVATEAYAQAFPVIRKKYDHPFQHLWSTWIAGGLDAVVMPPSLVHDYVGPFAVTEEVPAAYRPSVTLITRAILYSIGLADIIFSWIPEENTDSAEIFGQIGAASAHDVAYDSKGRRLPPKKIVSVCETKSFPGYWFVRGASDLVYCHNNPGDILADVLAKAE